MKTSLRKLRNIALHRHGGGTKDQKDPTYLPQFDDLDQATQDMQDMRDRYDSLLSAAAATAKSALPPEFSSSKIRTHLHKSSSISRVGRGSQKFSESMKEMGECLLGKSAVNDDEESGKVLLMLGKVQFELRKLVHSYRSHIIQTITSPSESLLNEIRTVEEMKRQCDEKRNVYEYMAMRHKEKGRSKSGKGESLSVQHLQAAHDEYQEEATLLFFRLKSLKQGQSRSLLTQAARHHAAQMNFYKKSLKSLEEVQPHVQSITRKHHIDYHFRGLEDDEGENGDPDENDYDDDYYDDDDESDENDNEDDADNHDERDLSFDYKQQDQQQNMFSSSPHSMQLDQVGLTLAHVETLKVAKENLERNRRHSFSYRGEIGNSNQSAPLFSENKSDPFEKMQPLSARKFSSYVLPTPVATRGSTGLGNPTPMTCLNEQSNNSWLSSSLEHTKNERILGDEKIYGSAGINAPSFLRKSNRPASSARLPPRSRTSIAYPKKIKRPTFSTPLTTQPRDTVFVSMDHPQLFPRPILRNPVPQRPTASPKASSSASPTFISSPKISELHELPRPPFSPASKSSKPLGLVGYSCPLMPRGHVLSATNQSVVPRAASPLPQPPQILTRSFSIPPSTHRVVSEPLETGINSGMSQDVASPPLTPISLS